MWTEEAIKTLIMTNHKACIRALLALWEYQTASEQVIGEAIEDNRVGFNKPDSFTAKKFVEMINRNEQLGIADLIKLRFMLRKYAKQLVKIANLKEMVKPC